MTSPGGQNADIMTSRVNGPVTGMMGVIWALITRRRWSRWTESVAGNVRQRARDVKRDAARVPKDRKRCKRFIRYTGTLDERNANAVWV